MEPADSNEDKVARGLKRESMFLGGAVWFEAGGERHAVRIRNLSPGGMMIDFPQSRVKGSPAFASIKGIGEVSGHVAWYRDGRMGIEFDNEVDPDAARMKPASAPTGPTFNKPYIESRRPGLAIR